MSVTNNERYIELRNRLTNLQTEYAMSKSHADDTELGLLEKQIKDVELELRKLLFSLKVEEKNKSKEGELLK